MNTQEILLLAEKMDLLPEYESKQIIETKKVNNVTYHYVELKNTLVFHDPAQDDEGRCYVETSYMETKETIRLSITNGFLFVETNNQDLMIMKDKWGDMVMFKSKRID